MIYKQYEVLEQLFRQYYQKLLVDPLIVRITSYINPLCVTLSAGLFGILFVPAIVYGHNILAIFLLLLSGYLDTFDGALAPHTNSSTAFGAVLDIIMDRIVEFLVVFGFLLVDPMQRCIWCLLMLGNILICVTSFLVVGIFTSNDTEKGFYYSPGFIERAEAFIFFTLMVLFPYYFRGLSIVFSLLVFMTTVIRLYEFYVSCQLKHS